MTKHPDVFTDLKYTCFLHNLEPISPALLPLSFFFFLFPSLSAFLFPSPPLLSVLGWDIEPMVSSLLGTCSSTELQLHWFFLSNSMFINS